MPFVRLTWMNSQNSSDQGKRILALPINLGRAGSNELVLAEPHTGVSRWHARLTYTQGEITLTDLSSTNGTYVDRRPIRQTQISSGGEFIIDYYNFTLRLQVRCRNTHCRRPVDSRSRTCPWCGRFLADAVTQATPDHAINF